jgi:glycine/D-amino acid oxidase-like deaminating enzyme
MRALVVGAGIFGVTAALELRRRGHRVRLLDPGPLPHPLAASTDISKVVRLEYGADAAYAEMAERALDGWRRWNRELAPLFHETGVLFMRRSPLAAGTFEGDSERVLRARGHAPSMERIDGAVLRRRFPAWSGAGWIEGTFNAVGGWVESGRVVARLVDEARARGVDLQAGAFARLVEAGGRAIGVELADGSRLEADRVVLATGAWTPHALPEYSPFFRSNGMPVFHLRPTEPSLFYSRVFPVFGADISETGYYGFPLHPTEGVVKIANHGPGRALHPHAPERVVNADEIAALRAFLADTFPALAAAPLVGTRVCVYCDTWDGHFWIAEDPARPGVVLATGGSGHAFKFAPLLGALIADAVEGGGLPRFRWRPEVRPPRSDEAARHQP